MSNQTIHQQRAKLQAEIDAAREQRAELVRRMEELRHSDVVTPMQAQEERDSKRKADAERKAEAEARQLKNRLRARYMAVAGATEEQFEDAFPRLLQEHAEAAALGRADDLNAPADVSEWSDPKRWGL